MRIAHINNIANVAWRLAEAQRRLGHEAVVFSVRDNPFQFPFDVRVENAEGPLFWNAAMLRRTKLFASFDVVHVHGGIWVSQVFYPLFRRVFPTKVLAVHYHGSETRTGKGLHHQRAASVEFHSTPDLGKWLPRSMWIPNPIDVGDPPPPPGNPRTIFVHFPSVRERKGTDRIIALFGEAFGSMETDRLGTFLRHRADDAELWIGEGMAHEDVLRTMRQADVLIDQFSPFGSYGVAAIEAMAYGKPVLGTANPEYYVNCPIVRLDAPDIVARMQRVARHERFRRELGQASRIYVATVHDSLAVTRRVLRAYYEALKRPALSTGEARAFWRRRGHSYAAEITRPEVRQRYQAQEHELLTILDRLRVRSVSEIGCGYGRIGRLLAGRDGMRWTGLDLSEGQLGEARRQERSLAPRLVQASADRLPLTDASADLVLAVELLMHIPPDRIAAVAQELWRVSRRYIVHLDWYEDYLAGFETGWCWVHDYASIWRSLGGTAKEFRLASTGIQSVFVVEKPSAQSTSRRGSPVDGRGATP